MFIDEVIISVQAGRGGDGIVAFLREKYMPMGGPSGGDGGNGGDLFMEATRSVNTLQQFRHKRKFKAEKGQLGQGSNRTGKSGIETVLLVPVGTQIFNAKTEELIIDLAEDGQRHLVQKGGRGGKGNAQFANPVNQAPRKFTNGRTTEVLHLRLSLKVLAEVGLVGYPNAGKSTLISTVSAAKPTIASYPFTTINPHLGVVDLGNWRTMVWADIPGLIEGAHRGTGLGHKFLRHLERCELLIFMLDLSDTENEPEDALKTLRNELALFAPELAEKPWILVGSKLDAICDEERREVITTLGESHQVPHMVISSAVREGLKELKEQAWKILHPAGDSW